MSETTSHNGDSCRARWLLLAVGSVLAVATVVAAQHVAPLKLPPAATGLTLIYVGADDCAPCRAWQSRDAPDFRKSPEFSRISYREVKSARLLDVLNDEFWPEEIRPYRQRLKRTDGVPLWLIVSGDDVVAQAFGAAAWNASILPALKSQLR